ncbi:hypothetical protein H1R20_g4801, partial [Candolleomyces eurysporus]
MTQSPWSSLTGTAPETSCPASYSSPAHRSSWWSWLPAELNLLVPTILLATTVYTSSLARTYYRAFQQSKARNAQLSKRLDELKRSLGDSDAEVRALNVRVQQTDEQKRTQALDLKEQLSKASEELSRVQKQNEELLDSRSQLEREISELRAQATPEDQAASVSESDAIQLLNDLNADLSKVGSGLAEEGTKVVKEVEEALRGALKEPEGDNIERPTSRPHRFFPDRKLSDSPASLHDVELPPPPPQNMYTYPYSNPQQPMGIPFPTAPPPSSSRQSGSSGSSSEGRSQGPYERQVAERREREQREAEEAENARMKEEAQEATTQAVEVFGQKLVGFLQAGGPAARDVPEEEKRSITRTFELAFKTALSAYTHWMMCSWFFDDDRQEGNEGLDLEGMLSEVYARVREGEEQAISGQWRSVTRKHVQRMFKRPQSRSSSNPGSKRNSNEDPAAAVKTESKETRIVEGSLVEEPEQVDPLLEELCVYIIDALVNVLIVSGVHGGWFLDDSLSTASSSSEEEDDDDGVDSEQTMLGGEDAEMGDYVDVYHDPYKGHSRLDLYPPTGGPSTLTNDQVFAQREARRKERGQRREREQRLMARRRKVTKKYNHTHLHAHLTSIFKPDLLRILRKAKALNKVLGEGVVWCDLEALYVAPGVGFEEATMERSGGEGGVESGTSSKGMGEPAASEGSGVVEDDEDGDRTPRTGGSPNTKQGPAQQYKRSPEKPEERPVLCTTHLGLVRAEKVPKTRGEWKEEVLVKPRVVLVGDY